MRRLKRTGGAILLSSSLLIGGLGGHLHQHARAASDSTTLIMGSIQEPESLNPMITQEVAGAEVDNMVFDGLFISDPHTNFVPQLATSYGVSSNGLTWTFHLRKGVKWADGVPFTADDVIYTYNAHFNKKNNVFNTQGWDQIDHYSMPDPYTAIFHIKHPYAPFLAYVGVSSILPQHIYGKPGVDFNKTPYNRTPLGTGPYMVKEFKSADHITLVPNPYSWRPAPYFKTVIYKIVPNLNTMLVQLRTGDLDVGLSLDSGYAKQAANISGKQLITKPGISWYHIDLKQWGFLREKVVRQALDYATPKQAIIKGILGGLGTLETGDIAPLITKYYDSNVPVHTYSLTKASALLAADGFTKGSDGVLQKGGQPFSMELWTDSSDDTGQKITTLLKNIWKKIGVQVDVRSQSSNTIYGASGPQFSKKMTGLYFSWTVTTADPDDDFFWNSTQIPKSPTGSGGNDVGYFYKFDFQKQIDDLTNAELVTTDYGKRKAIFDKIEYLLADEVPVIFIYWGPDLTVVPNNLTGYQDNPFAYFTWNVASWRRG